MKDQGTGLLLARRDFIRGAVRYGLLAALTALGIVAVRRSNAACQRNFICGSCPKFNGCPLPAARENQKQEMPS